MNTQLLESPTVAKSAEGRSVNRRVASTALHPPNPLERIALRVGIALIIWGRRRARPGLSREERERRNATIVARERFERLHERRWHLEGPRR